MGFYFKGRIVSDENVVKKLFTDEPRCENIGDRIWVWTNQKTGVTIITGDEGNSWCVVLAKSESAEEAMRKLKTKREKGEIFTTRMQRILTDP